MSLFIVILVIYKYIEIGFMVVLLSICLWYVSTMATCIAAHFAVCHALYNNKNKKIGKNRCLVFLNDLVLFCSVILSL